MFKTLIICWIILVVCWIVMIIRNNQLRRDIQTLRDENLALADRIYELEEINDYVHQRKGKEMSFSIGSEQ